MDIEFYIKAKERCKADSFTHPDDNDHLLIAIKALEKQVPKKTTSQRWNGINGVPYKNCPTCDQLLWGGSVFDKKDRNCSNCGQKIDWD